MTITTTRRAALGAGLISFLPWRAVFWFPAAMAVVLMDDTCSVVKAAASAAVIALILAASKPEISVVAVTLVAVGVVAPKVINALD
mgnify:CR=1 FL=1